MNIDSILFYHDGGRKEVDCVVLCTGYQHRFPFLAEALRLTTTNRFYPGRLYKGIFWQDEPKLAYLAMQDLGLTLAHFDAQAWYLRDVILGRISLPDAEYRQTDMSLWQSREEQLDGPFDCFDFQVDYIKDLLSVTDYPPVALDANVAVFKQSFGDKRDDIATYRDKSYPSAFTGTVGTAMAVRWVDIVRDD